MTSPKLRAAIIGPGGIARGAHAPFYIKDSRTEIAAVVSRTHEKAAAFAEEFHIPAAYDCADTMLEAEKPDLVSICTPNKFHREMVLKSLEAGCHVLCEKPPAMTAEEAEEMEEAAERAGRHLVYAFHHRYNPETRVLKKAIESGDLGSIYHTSVQAMRRRGIPGWGVFTSKELQGGGPLIDVGVHMLDLALYLTGYPEPVEVMGATHKRIGNRPGTGLMGQWDPENYNVEDLASGMVRFQNGMSMVIETSFAANQQDEETLNVRLLGDRGGADTSPLRLYEERYGALFDSAPAFLEKTDSGSSYERQITHFIDCCLDKSRPLATPADGTTVQRIVNAIYESSAKSSAVSLI
ncbi:Gfo/Idh/MocA family protein [Alteribacter natronophilus]|uniref:Gfo/Idh/MocA family protein n=1 Tax=Alteribacter natronophilus TaxID=2583810 RepID=UPI00110E4FB4|nr:Gfo/Idh/MocA family oxidoreductase [Alteribacter natronophilus]TMW72433.1 Gfo/Idh/MocA family oxidoreductase [Alteribacter natronophilus]